jgi:RimJ/RimL family protein N-acetyltransferase
VARHDLTASGYRFRLRPLQVTDAAFVVKLRRDPTLSRYINPTSPSEADQRAWTEAYLLRDNDYCFVVEDAVNGEREGTISTYNVDPVARQGEMGRWILRPGSFAAPESALLAYRLAFESLGLRRVYCRTLRDNEHVVSFHRSSGLVEAGPAPAVVLDGTSHEAVEQYVTDKSWPDVERALERSATAAARLLRP